MKNNKPGFTLIELLVVVLIIGILAAVALPQYQMAVNKSRVTQAYVMLRALAGSQERYFLETQTYATSFGQLDVTISPGCTSSKCAVGDYYYVSWTNPQRQIEMDFPSTFGLVLSYFYADPDPSSVYYPQGVRKGYYRCNPQNQTKLAKICAKLSTGTQFKVGSVYYWKP